ncbi:MAG TPA: hypothetical protein VIV11_41825 [Kofleriaceae bacterium]
MNDPSSVSNVDLRASRTKRFIFAGVLVALFAVGGIVVFKLATAEPGAEACEHLAELAKTDPLADQVVDKLERFVESSVATKNIVKGQTPVEVSGTTPDDRCRSAIDYLDKAMGHGPFTRMVDCIASAKTARAAAQCF